MRTLPRQWMQYLMTLAVSATAMLMATEGVLAAQSKALAIDRSKTALVVIDPQVEVLSERGGAWPLVKDNLKEVGTIENMDKLFKAAKSSDMHVFVSPHYYYPTDDQWHFRDPLSNVMHENHMFEVKGITDTSSIPGSTADWLPRFKPYIEDGKTVVVGPHKLYGPQTNDLILQLRKRDIKVVILSGMLAHMCVESHARDFIENGFEVIVARDAVGAPRHPEWGDGYVSAMINFRYIANHVLTADELVKAIRTGSR